MLNFVAGCGRLNCGNTACSPKIWAKMSAAFTKNILIRLMAISQTSVFPQLSTSGACWADPMHQPRQSFCFQSKSKSGDSINQITSKFPSNTVWSRIHMIPRLPPIGRSNTFAHKNNSGMKQSERHNWRLEQTSGRPLADCSMHTLFCNWAIEMSFWGDVGTKIAEAVWKNIMFFKKKEATLSITWLLP